MGKEVERLKEVEERVKGLERDNRELAKQGAINQRTLVTLREVKLLRSALASYV